MSLTDREQTILNDLDKEIGGLRRGKSDELKLGDVLARELDLAAPDGDGAPKLDSVSEGSISINANEPALTLTGRNLLNDQTFGQRVFGTGTSAITLKARRPGEDGNDISMVITNTGGGGLAVTLTGTAIAVNRGAAATTADQLKTALEANEDIDRLVEVTSGGAGVVAVASKANLAGGTGEGVIVLVNGVAQAVDETITDTSIHVACDAIGTPSVGLATVLVQSNGVWSNPLAIGIEDAVTKWKKIAVGTGTNAAVDSGWDLPAHGLVHDVFIEVHTAEVTGATKTLDVGTLVGESGGDADGFLDGVSVASVGIKKAAFVATVGSNNTYLGAAGTHTRGVLLTELLIAGEDTAAGGDGFAQASPYATDSLTAKSVSYTRGSTFSEFAGFIWVRYTSLVG